MRINDTLSNKVKKEKKTLMFSGIYNYCWLEKI